MSRLTHGKALLWRVSDSETLRVRPAKTPCAGCCEPWHPPLFTYNPQNFTTSLPIHPRPAKLAIVRVRHSSEAAFARNLSTSRSAGSGGAAGASSSSSTAEHAERRGPNRLNRIDPSTGFHAVLTMAFQCKRLTAFGFDGDATYDGHEITPEHPIAIEHVLLRLLQRGGAIAGLPRGWERTQLVMAPQVPPRDRVPVGKKGARQ